MEEVRRRHRIKAVYVSTKVMGFGLQTNGGQVFFALGKKYTIRKLMWHLPHISEELIESDPNTREELEDLLLGRYVYGRSVLVHHKFDEGDCESIILV